VAGILAVFIDRPISLIFQHLQQTAAYFAGGPRPEVVTYPMWGLAIVLWLIPSVSIVMTIQVAFGCVAAAALFMLIRREWPARGRELAFLFITAVPWFFILIQPYPQGFAGAFIVLAIVYAEKSIRCESMINSIISGVCFGLAQNFRSELLLLPWFSLCVLLILGRRRSYRFLKPMFCAAIVALIIQIPWCLFYYQQTGRPKLAESTGWAAAYGALGQLPGNPWKIEFSDGFLSEVIKKEGYSFDWTSDPAGEVFRAKFVTAIREHPGALVRTWARRIRLLFLAPFYAGHARMQADEAEMLDVCREKIKQVLGIAPNMRQIAEYHETGIWDRPPRWTVLSALVYEMLSQGCIIIVFFLSIVGLVRTLFCGLLKCDSIILPLLACTVLNKLSLSIFFSHRVDYLNNVYLFCIPFVLIALDALRVTRTSGLPYEEKAVRLAK
jgi:hypothetical protein